MSGKAIVTEITAETDLWNAVCSANVTLVAELLAADTGMDINIVHTHKSSLLQFTCLQFATMLGMQDMVSLILAYPGLADDKHHFSPALTVAGEFECDEIIKLILATGIFDVNARSDSGFARLMYLLKNEAGKLHKYLDDIKYDGSKGDGFGFGAAAMAAGRGSVAELKVLVEAKADLGVYVNANSTTSSLIHCASFIGHADAITYLVGQGVDVNLRDSNFNTPLHQCLSETADLHCFTALVNLKADLNAHNKFHLSPLHIIAQTGKTHMVQGIVEMKADINGRCSDPEQEAKDEDGVTPLHLAVAEGHNKTMELLLTMGADLNTVNSSLNSPMHVAAGNGQLATVQLLLDKGAAVTGINVFGKQPIHEAAENGHLECVKTLIVEAKISPVVESKDGKIPLQYALAAQQTEMADYLRPLSGKHCQLCGQTQGELLTCASCNSVRYCSRKHQKIDWKQGHKAACQSATSVD